MIRRMLRKERTDYGKKMRNQYEAGEFWDSRHNMTVHAIRPDELSNTLSTVLKDNLLIEIHGINEPKGERYMTNFNEIFHGNPFNYVSLFSGIGGFEQALNKLGGTCVMASEIDKFANQAYEVLYGHPTVGDVTKVAAEDVPDHDVLVGGFPCQAFSVAGKRLGFDDTRGTLFFEIARIAKVKRPKAMILENVKGLVGHDKGRTLDAIVQTLDEIGYTIDFEVMNSKYFGVPQNRERIFIIAVRNDLIQPEAWDVGKRTDVVAKGKRRVAQLDVSTFNFDWPAQEEVSVRLRDILESEVDERFYLSEDKTAKLVAQLEEKRPDDVRATLTPDREEKRQNGRRFKDTDEPAFTLNTQDRHGVTISEPQMVGHIDLKGHDAIKRVYSAEGVSPTLTTMGGGHREPKIAIEQFTQGDGVSCCVDASYAKGTSPGDVGKGRRTHVIEEVSALTERRSEEAKEIRKEYREKYGKDFSPRRGKVVVPRKDDVANCVTATQGIEQQLLEKPRYRIRKLTPRECFRLQGFPDVEFDKLTANGISNSQLYKMAGNAVTVNVIDAIGRRLITYL